MYYMLYTTDYIAHTMCCIQHTIYCTIYQTLHTMQPGQPVPAAAKAPGVGPEACGPGPSAFAFVSLLTF